MALVLERVLISDSVDPSCRQILESGGVAVDYRPGLGKEELLVAIKVLHFSSFAARACNGERAALSGPANFLLCTWQPSVQFLISHLERSIVLYCLTFIILYSELLYSTPSLPLPAHMRPFRTTMA